MSRSLSLEISFGKALVVNCEFTLRPERRRFLSESTPSVYPFAMDTSGSFCDTAILFLKKIAMVKFSDEPGSEPLLAWKRAIWVQETCLLIQAALLREASRSFHKGLHECFEKDYEHLFEIPQHSRIDNGVSSLSPIYIPAAG